MNFDFQLLCVHVLILGQKYFMRVDNIIFSRVKISCFRAKVHLVSLWHLCNKWYLNIFMLLLDS